VANFYGYRSVVATLKKHRRTAKITSGTLKVRGSDDGTTDVSWANLYVYPEDEATGMGAGGHPDITTQIVLYRTGETSKPRPDDKLTVGSDTYLLTRVASRLNADESRHYAVYDCDGVRN
jgi:hypothetical protein